MSIKLSSDKEKKKYETIVEIDHLERSLTSLEKKISEIKEHYQDKINEIEEEKNYDVLFKISIAVAGIFFLFKLTFSSFLLWCLIIAGYFAFKKYLGKESRKNELVNLMNQKTAEKIKLLEKHSLQLTKEKDKLKTLDYDD